jgi:hypothetical protein
MTLEQHISNVELRRHNNAVLYAMQLYYLDQFDECQQMGLTPKDIELYYISAIHPQQTPKQYQLHLNFHRENTEK